MITGGSSMRGDDLQAAAAVGAVFDVDVEDPFEQPGPTDARRFSLTLGVIGRGLVPRSAGVGTILLRNLALGASTPWKRIRCRRGRGTGSSRIQSLRSGENIWRRVS